MSAKYLSTSEHKLYLMIFILTHDKIDSMEKMVKNICVWVGHLWLGGSFLTLRLGFWDFSMVNGYSQKCMSGERWHFLCA